MLHQVWKATSKTSDSLHKLWIIFQKVSKCCQAAALYKMESIGLTNHAFTNMTMNGYLKVKKLLRCNLWKRRLWNAWIKEHSFHPIAKNYKPLVLDEIAAAILEINNKLTLKAGVTWDEEILWLHPLTIDAVLSIWRVMPVGRSLSWEEVDC